MINKVMIEAKAINGRLRRNQQVFTASQTPDEIATQLQQILRPWKVKVCAIGCTDVRIQEFSIGGFFDSERIRQPITINVFFNEKQRKFMWLRRKQDEFFFLVSQVLQHELIHQQQHSKRPADAQEIATYYQVTARPDMQDEVDYLSEFDEIDAYAHDIALEIVHNYPTLDRYDVLRTINRRRHLFSWSLYTKTFKNCDDWSQVRNRLLGKIYRWLPHIIE